MLRLGTWECCVCCKLKGKKNQVGILIFHFRSFDCIWKHHEILRVLVKECLWVIY